jgi:hypothetical protein
MIPKSIAIENPKKVIRLGLGSFHKKGWFSQKYSQDIIERFGDSFLQVQSKMAHMVVNHMGAVKIGIYLGWEIS